MRGSVLLFALLLALGASPSFAEPVPEPSIAPSAETFFLPEYQDPASERPSAAGNVVGFLFKFGAVIGLIYGVFWVYRRMGGPALAAAQGTLAPGGMRVQTLGSTHLRGAQTVHLVSAGGRVWVVGSNGKDMLVPLGELTPEEGKAAFTAHLEQAESEGEGFDSVIDATLRQVMVNKKGGLA